MLSPRTMAQVSSPINSSPNKNACASPSGDGWTTYEMFTPKWDPSFNNYLKLGWSSGVVITNISFIPANISVDNG